MGVAVIALMHRASLRRREITRLRTLDLSFSIVPSAELNRFRKCTACVEVTTIGVVDPSEVNGDESVLSKDSSEHFDWAPQLTTGG
ncbi:hypothetical protein CKO51_20475 [Rhodopirellula sp. SM50]|nr:hypothetical protein CKO51_20475 [Rhodopirellula sp. SM50]